MARKNLQRLGKAAALLGTAFAASKMLGSGGEDAAIQKGLEVTRAKPFGMSDDAAIAKIANTEEAVKKGLEITRAKPFGQTDEAQTPGFFGTIRGALGRAGMRFQKGGSVVAKVKLGRTKPTKLY
jgi:hypothetical protein